MIQDLSYDDIQDLDPSSFDHSYKPEGIPYFQKDEKYGECQGLELKPFPNVLDNYDEDSEFYWVNSALKNQETLQSQESYQNQLIESATLGQILTNNFFSDQSEEISYKKIKTSEGAFHSTSVRSDPPCTKIKKDLVEHKATQIVFFDGLKCEIKSSTSDTGETVVKVDVKNLPGEIAGLNWDKPKNFLKKYGDRFLEFIYGLEPHLRSQLRKDCLSSRPIWNAVFNADKRGEYLLKPKVGKLMRGLNENNDKYPAGRWIELFLEFAANFNPGNIQEPHNDPEENEIYKVLSTVIKAGAFHILNAPPAEFEYFEIEKVHKKEGIFKYRTSSKQLSEQISGQTTTLSQNSGSPFNDLDAILSPKATRETLDTSESSLKDIIKNDSRMDSEISKLIRAFDECVGQSQRTENKEDFVPMREDLIQKHADYESEAYSVYLKNYQLTKTDNTWICSLENLLINKMFNTTK